LVHGASPSVPPPRLEPIITPDPTVLLTGPINANDVIFGRGGGTNRNPGNVRFRSLVANNRVAYLGSRKGDKPLYARSVVAAVRGACPPGRFLRRTGKDGEDGWYDVGDDRAREKTSQALREGAPHKENAPNGALPHKHKKEKKGRKIAKKKKEAKPVATPPSVDGAAPQAQVEEISGGPNGVPLHGPTPGHPPAQALVRPEAQDAVLPAGTLSAASALSPVKTEQSASDIVQL